MKQNKLLFLVASLLFIANLAAGQVGMATENNEFRTTQLENPEVGKPMPDFTLENITNYKTTKASLKDFRGKWLILDLWFKGCATCIESFPHINELQGQFKDKVQFLLVGYNAKRVGGNSIIDVYNDFNKIKKLNNLVSAYDSIIIKKWNIWSFPYVYIVNPEGTLLTITDGRDITKEKIDQLINGGSPKFFPKNRKAFNDGIDNQTPADSDSLIMYQSILTKFTNQDFFIPKIDYQLGINTFKRKGYKVSGVALPFFYNLAYFGVHHWTRRDSLYNIVYRQPILNVRDSSQFLWNDRLIKGLYNYSLNVPKEKATKEGLMKVMQGDLNNFFGYKASIEIRKMPVWLLIKTNERVAGNLKTKGGKTNYKGESTGLSLINFPWVNVLYELDRHLREVVLAPLFDETGINGNVDLKITALMSDMEQVKKELQKYGLNIIKGEKEMKVLVISDQDKL